MQDVSSFVKAQSPLSLAISGIDTKSNASSNAEPKIFFSIILEGLSQESVPSLNENNQATLLTASLGTESSIEISPDDKAKSIDEHLLDDLLKIVDSLKANSTLPLLPTLNSSPQLEKIINNQTALKEFSEAKSISEVLSLAKKYDLGLEKISFSKESIESLQKEFPTLAKSNFFENASLKEKVIEHTSLKEEKNTSTATLNPVEKNIKKTDIQEQPSALKELMSKEQSSLAETKTLKSNALPAEKLLSPIEQNLSKETLKENVKAVQTAEVLPKEATKTIPSSVEISTQKVIAPAKEELKNEKKVKPEATLKANAPSQNDAEEILLKTAPSTRVQEPKMELPTSKGLTEALLQAIKIEKPIAESPVADKSITLEADKQTAAPLSTDDSTTSTLKTETTTLTTEAKNISKQEPLLKQTVSAKESLSQFANDFKEKVEAYKPPIMKMELSLFPKSLGEVDVTLLTRGTNLHVNISSNTSTMTLFTQNQAEFKNALVNMGFTNLEMNFSDQRGHEKNQQHTQGNSKTDFFDESSEETLAETTRMELVIPQYV